MLFRSVRRLHGAESAEEIKSQCGQLECRVGPSSCIATQGEWRRTNDFCKGLATVKVLLQHWKQVFGIHYLRIKSRLEPQVIVIAQGGSVKVEACIQVESVRHGFRVGWHNIGNMAAKNSLPIIRSKKQEYWPPKLKAPEQIFSVQAEPRPGKKCDTL